ncbi:MAG: hypothetical protein P857_139 [Candidatus Xenolissoclinum pacificiensis L6]|uniref:OmpA-like domain-containing protein n=1 Tax=Candidatus Xenolissoclinum pacificiensis L6 TaxID=1401685 RepID=W2UYQ1_9RICK|nr:MAG: hypothetical protein P857_139 [Candidatus Xenolissoclinum pacificiensis L6]
MLCSTAFVMVLSAASCDREDEINPDVSNEGGEMQEYLVTDAYNKCLPIGDSYDMMNVMDMIPMDIASFFFRFDSSDIFFKIMNNPSLMTQPVLDESAACIASMIRSGVLKLDSDLRITFNGYCDIRGTGVYNIALGYRRANAVRDYLHSVIVDELMNSDASMSMDEGVQNSYTTLSDVEKMVSDLFCVNSFGSTEAQDTTLDSIRAMDRRTDIAVVHASMCNQ